jgi:hypothetical protein
MDKGSKVPEVAQTLRNAHAAGIANHVFLICGFPTETEEEYADTIKFLDENKDCIYAIHRGTFSLEPESPIFEHQERFGITRSWLIRDTSSGGRWGYECSSGMSMERVREVFISSLPFLRVFNPYARVVANFRDHALLLYSKQGSQLRPEARRFPKITYAPKGLAGHGPAFQVMAINGRDSEKSEVLEDCKVGTVSMTQPGDGPDVRTGGGVTAKQISDFFANAEQQKVRASSYEDDMVQS